MNERKRERENERDTYTHTRRERERKKRISVTLSNFGMSENGPDGTWTQPKLMVTGIARYGQKYTVNQIKIIL